MSESVSKCVLHSLTTCEWVSECVLHCVREKVYKHVRLWVLEDTVRVFFPLLVSDSESVTSPHHVIQSSCLRASMAYERLSAVIIMKYTHIPFLIYSLAHKLGCFKCEWVCRPLCTAMWWCHHEMLDFCAKSQFPHRVRRRGGEWIIKPSHTHECGSIVSGWLSLLSGVSLWEWVGECFIKARSLYHNVYHLVKLNKWTSPHVQVAHLLRCLGRQWMCPALYVT